MGKPLLSRLRADNSGISPVIGAILMLLLTILLAGITVSCVYGNGFSDSLSKAPMAVIEVESIEGGVPTEAKYKENYIVLLHKGGEPLHTGSTKLIITGEGSAFIGLVANGDQARYGEVFIIYDHLGSAGKDNKYALLNQDLSDDKWSAGEKLILNGDDSSSSDSSITVKINGLGNTSNNYGLKQGSIVNIKVFDIKTQKIIAECEHSVVLAR
ncbi:type IV pilin N-terminal domain-containing protein [Methanolobus halotolerans]|uniref:Archaeal Type IV pilin N-terminal domain-containing protein n=1 Tax=Methanolobus halotolerans TaxID=2052935 RepID=A0A4E0Q8N7_9EURY|nr:type IV pilin N-terminal domain-containing protein [Methanolobus halotolerans]TGC11146.1 hypothetical protein CUN85_03130 [Methanolobus halotolerans]